jgi:hypothetical protein
MIQQLPQSSANVLGFRLSGKLHDEDHKKFVPVVDAAVATGLCRPPRLGAHRNFANLLWPHPKKPPMTFERP